MPCGALPFGAGSTYHTARGLRVTQAVLLSAAGVWRFSKTTRGNLSGRRLQAGSGATLAESPLGKEAKCARSGVVKGQGPTTRPAEAYPKAEAGDTPRYLGPNGPWMPLRLWSYLCSLSWAVGMVGLSQALLS